MTLNKSELQKNKLHVIDNSNKSRRNFMKNTTLGAFGAFIGMNIPFAKNFPAGLIPVAMAESNNKFVIPGKNPEVILLNDRPLNAEVPPYLLDDDITPESSFFVRNNGVPPIEVNPETWSIEFSGESVEKAVTFSLQDLKKEFKHYTYQAVLECGGNGRAEFVPGAKGNQWTTGAVSNAEWTGIRLADVLKKIGIKKDAVYIGYYGKDTHLSGAPGKVAISRGVPLVKALKNETILAFKMNGKDIPALHGAPVRLIAGGYPASASGKWITKIVVRNKVHDGQKMMGSAYRTPCHPVAPGAHVDYEDMCIIESMPVKSLITSPATGKLVKSGETVRIRGHAWAGELAVKEVSVSIDFGQTWKKTTLKKAKNRFAWQTFEGDITIKEKGYYEIWAKATDSEGRSQPMVVPGWNPKGYLNNACHRISLRVG